MIFKNKFGAKFIISSLFFLAGFGLFNDAEARHFSTQITVNAGTRYQTKPYLNVIADIDKTSYLPGEKIIFSHQNVYTTQDRPIDIFSDPEFINRTDKNFRMIEGQIPQMYVNVVNTAKPVGSSDTSYRNKAHQTPIAEVDESRWKDITKWTPYIPARTELKAPQCVSGSNNTYYVSMSDGSIHIGDIPFTIICPINSDTVQTSCTGPDGLSIVNGTNKNYFSKNQGTARECLDSVESRNCRDGVLSGTAMYSTCSGSCLVPISSVSPTVQPIKQTPVQTQTSCVGPDGSIISNKSGKYYYSRNCGLPVQCYISMQFRRCTNGVLSGTATNSSCKACVSTR